jgi:hypothetical protein
MGVDHLCRSAVLYTCASGCWAARRSPADCRRDPVSGNHLWRHCGRKICPRKKLRAPSAHVPSTSACDPPQRRPDCCCRGKAAKLSVRVSVLKWRRGRDSNPRYGCPYAAFRVRCIQPLCHLSAAGTESRCGAPCSNEGGAAKQGPRRPGRPRGTWPSVVRRPAQGRPQRACRASRSGLCGGPNTAQPHRCGLRKVREYQ